MKVAIVYRNFNLGGSLERDVVLLAGGLASRGAQVYCYCNPGTRSVQPEGVALVDVRPLTRSRSRFGQPLETASFAVAATRALRRDRRLYDVVDVTGISAWEADVVTVHGVTKALQRRWPNEAGRNFRGARIRGTLAPVLRPQISVARAIERLQFGRGRRRAIAVTEAVRRDLVEVHGVREEAIAVIPPPVDVDRFAGPHNGAVRSELGLAAGETIVLFVGHDFARKGLDRAIAVVAGLSASVRLVVVGEGPRATFEEAALRAGISDRILFVGRTERPERFFSAADIFLLPTRQDPWGIPLIEAMAAGIPVVTTAAAGAAAAVEAAGAGIVIEDGSSADVSAAVRALVEHPAKRREFGARGRVAARRFGVDGHVDRVLDVYERVIREKCAGMAAPAEAA